MSTTAIPLLLNPVAGRGKARKTSLLMVREFQSRGIAVDLIESSGVGDLERRTHELAISGTTRIVVAGGDGSVHEAANGILASGTDTSLGIVPVGTGNDFAKAIATPLDWREAAAQLAVRIRNPQSLRAVDAGKINDRFFVNGAGIGFDAKINAIAKKYRWPTGSAVYLIAALEGLWDGVITPRVSMRFGDDEYHGPITLANISNGPWLGGMFHIAPMADVSDGRLDLIMADPMSRFRILCLLPDLVRGTHLAHPDVRHREVRDFRLVAEAPLPSHLDGESQPLQTVFNGKILPDALAIL